MASLAGASATLLAAEETPHGECLRTDGASSHGASSDDDLLCLAFRQHADYVARVVYRTLGHDRDVDDIVQQTFCDAAESIGQLRSPLALRAWLVAIAVRNSKRWEKTGRRRRMFLALLGDFAPWFESPTTLDPLANLVEKLETLGEELRIPWVLHHFEGCTLPETAELCGVSLATIKRRIACAEQSLRGEVSV